jgi:hypothetical protein
MAGRGHVGCTDEDPATVIALIYRIVDEPRRAITLVSILLPILALIIQVGASATMVARIPAPVIWWAGTAAWEISWCTKVYMIWRKSRRGQQ